MTAPLTAALPEWLILDHGYTITLAAVSPTTGAPVAGVQITDGAVTGRQTAAEPANVLPPDPPPLLTNVNV